MFMRPIAGYIQKCMSKKIVTKVTYSKDKEKTNDLLE